MAQAVIDPDELQLLAGQALRARLLTADERAEVRRLLDKMQGGEQLNKWDRLSWARLLATWSERARRRERGKVALQEAASLNPDTKEPR